MLFDPAKIQLHTVQPHSEICLKLIVSVLAISVHEYIPQHKMIRLRCCYGKLMLQTARGLELFVNRICLLRTRRQFKYSFTGLLLPLNLGVSKVTI